MAVQVEIWQDAIKEHLFASNVFLNYLRNADEYVVGGSIVHIPQSGGPANVERNRSVYPAPIVRRGDTDIVYALDTFTTDALHIPYAESVEVSYDKTMSVIRENASNLVEVAGDWLIWHLIQNATANEMFASTGEASVASAPGATGNRREFHVNNLKAMKVLFNKQNIPSQRRYCLATPDMLDQLSNDKDLKYAFQNAYNLREGSLPRIEGFQLIERSKVARLTNALGVKLPNSANAVDDRDVALCWQQDALERAMGSVMMFQQQGAPEYHGDLYSFLIRLSGRACRADNKGYGLIYRADAA